MDQLTTRIDELNAGADDHLVKFFDLRESIARVDDVARRYAGNLNPGSTQHRSSATGGERRRHRARRRAPEWAVLDRPSQHRRIVARRNHLVDAPFRFGAEVVSSAVEIYFNQPRKKIGHPLIETSRSLRYWLAKP